MIRILTLIMVLFFVSNTVTAKEMITIYSRYAVSDLAHKQLIYIVNKMNNEINTYSFRISVLPGASGETSARRSLADARAGIKNFLFTSLDVFTLNKHMETVDNDFEYDKQIDFYHVQGFGSSAHGLISSLNASSLDEMVEDLRKKPVIFYGISNNSPRTKLLSEVFLKHYNFTNIKSVSFRAKTDILLSLLAKEIDFGVTTPENMLTDDTKLMLMATRETNLYYPNVPTGVQIGMNEFISEAQTFFTIPRQFIGFAQELRPTMLKICKEEDFKNMLVLFKRKHSCLGPEELSLKIKEDYDWYINNQ